MNAKLKMNIILILTGALILSLASCSNPSAVALASLTQPETGIDSDPVSGLIAGLPLEGDAILNHPDVSVSDGVEWVEGLSGNALRVDRTEDPNGDFLRIDEESGILPEFTTAGSVEVWVKPEANASWAGILHKGELVDFTDESWSLQYNGSKQIMFNLNSDTKNASLNTGVVLVVDEWHHLAATWDVDETNTLTMKIYIDGVQAGSTLTVADFGTVKHSDGDLIIGSQLPVAYDSSFGYISFLGLIDEISLFDRLRTAEEIEGAYQEYFPA